MASTVDNGAHAPRKVELNEVEARLRRLLLDVAAHVNPERPSQLRYTGGWVRDKLLGVGSCDIDVAIDDMTGYQFGLRMKGFLEAPGNAARYGLVDAARAGADDDSGAAASAVVDESRLVHNLHKIEANPEKSKHLETVTTRVFGLDVDMVNLRKEVYDDLSRNPQMEFGTPKEDADRRDATVNAMFYNLQTERVEDFTGRGLADLAGKTLMTPLEPLQTFKDDPLRILRLIRFASRLGFAIDPAVEDAMRDEAVKASLKVKISRERVGAELEKTLKGPDPYNALQRINDLGLYNTIFSDPTATETFSPEISSWAFDFGTVHHLLQTCSPTKDVLILDDHDIYLAWTLSCFVPFNDAPEAPKPKEGSRAPPPLGATVAREGIKANNQVSNVIAFSIANSSDILSIKAAFTAAKRSPGATVATSATVIGNPLARDVLGQAIRRWGPTWRNQALFAFLLDSKAAAASGRDALKEWSAFLSHLKEHDLLEAYDLKPIMDGTTLAKAMGARPGPWMKSALEVVVAWQLRNPGSFSIEEAIAAVKASGTTAATNGTNGKHSASPSTSGELTAALIHHFLQLTLRPLFSKTADSRAHTVTPLGRKREASAVAPRRPDSIEDESTRPWKSAKHADALPILKWCVERLTPELAERQWPLLVPPILTLLDDMQAQYRAQGAELLVALLKSTSPAFLARTGLGPVFMDALTPSLHHLPTLTPEAESIEMLAAAYPAVFALLAVQHPPARSEREHGRRVARMLHDHVLPSLAHLSPSGGVASAYPRLRALLHVQLQQVIAALGLNTVAHLVYIVPALAETLHDPFAPATVDGLRLVATAGDTLAKVLAAAGPRAAAWRGEAVAMLAAAWVNVADAQDDPPLGDGSLEEFDAARETLVGAAADLARAVELHGIDDDGRDCDDNCRVVDLRAELRACVAADARLAPLFGPLL